jgi:hypothetical protein
VLSQLARHQNCSYHFAVTRVHNMHNLLCNMGIVSAAACRWSALLCFNACAPTVLTFAPVTCSC